MGWVGGEKKKEEKGGRGRDEVTGEVGGLIPPISTSEIVLKGKDTHYLLKVKLVLSLVLKTLNIDIYIYKSMSKGCMLSCVQLSAIMDCSPAGSSP